MVIEEWIVDQLSLRDSLYSYIGSTIESDTNGIDKGMLRFSSYDFIKGVDSTLKMEPLDGSIVMGKLSIDSDKGFLKSAFFEIREPYVVPFDALSFAMPKEYERIELVKEE